MPENILNLKDIAQDIRGIMYSARSSEQQQEVLQPLHILKALAEIINDPYADNILDALYSDCVALHHRLRLDTWQQLKYFRIECLKEVKIIGRTHQKICMLFSDKSHNAKLVVICDIRVAEKSSVILVRRSDSELADILAKAEINTDDVEFNVVIPEHGYVSNRCPMLYGRVRSWLSNRHLTDGTALMEDGVIEVDKSEAVEILNKLSQPNWWNFRYES